VDFSQTQTQLGKYLTSGLWYLELSFAALADLFGEDTLRGYNKLRAYLPKTASGGVHGKF